MQKLFPSEGRFFVQQKLDQQNLSEDEKMILKFSKKQLPIVKRHIKVSPVKHRLPRDDNNVLAVREDLFDDIY